MFFKTHIPSFPLNQFIHSFFYYTGFEPKHRIDRLLPDGNVNIIIDLKEAPQYIFDNNTLQEIQTCRRVWFSGMRTEFISIPSGLESELFIINFHKGSSYPFVNMPLGELADSVVDGELVLSNDIIELRSKIIDAHLVDQKFLITERYLTEKYKYKLIPNPFVHFAVQTLVKTPNSISIKSLSEKVGYSQKHMIKIFKDHVGLTPKEFLKISRFQKVIEEIQSKKQISWTQLSFDCGFYDQAHLINDFKLFSGFTPADYLRRQGDYLNYVPVA